MEDTKRTDPPRIAPSPFDSPNKADFILCTSDDVHFHVYKTFLIVASQFFCNLFSDGTPNEYHDNLPFYRVPESSSTMAVVLRLCYPININIIDLFDSCDLDEELLSVLDKYIMEGPLARLRELVSTHAIATQKPLQTFGLARRLGCDDVARNAARRFLEICPLVELPIQANELKVISANELVILLKYRHSCGQAAAEVIAVRRQRSRLCLDAGPALSAEGLSAIWTLESCKTCSDACDLRIMRFSGRSDCWAHDWFHSFLDDIASMLRDNPRKKLAIDFIDNALYRVNPKCPDQSAAGLKAVLQALDKDIQSAVDKVSLGI